MSPAQAASLQNAGVKPLTACLILALGLGATHAASAFTTRTVSNCNDNGPGSLRAAMIASQDQDTVDLNALSCSTITLTTGALPAAGTLLLDAHNRAAPVIIDGGRQNGRHDRVIVHAGVNGHLYLSDVGVANGDYAGADPRGGCILSSGSVTIFAGSVTNCRVSGAGIAARGGGVYATGYFVPARSTMSGNVASASAANAYGGGVFAGSFGPQFSTLADNSAQATPGYIARGGGAYTSAVLIEGSTFSGNRADIGAAVLAHTERNAFSPRFIVNSTLSGNTAVNRVGGVFAYGSLYVSNSTIAFNSSTANFGFPAGLYVYGVGNFLQLDSSIVALNSAGGVTFDVAAAGTIRGGHNLVTAAIAAPADTLTSCPRLARLGNYGFLTQTHALLRGSPALDSGSNPINKTNDQRQLPRTVGAATDIGAVELQPGEVVDEIFQSGLENRCQ